MNDYFDYESRDGGTEPVSAHLASMNLEAQVRLVEDLRRAREQAGRTLADVAASLGVEVDVVSEIESRSRSLTLRELRLLAHASDAFVTYTVIPNVSRELEPDPEIEWASLYQEHWYSVDETSIEDTAGRLLASADA